MRTRRKRHPNGCECNTCDRRRTKRGVKGAVSLYIRTRDQECQFHKRLRLMNIPDPCICAGSFQCCHKIPVSKSHALEFDERNMFGGCAWSNNWSDKNRESWEKLWRELFPEDVAYLDRGRHADVRRNRGDLKAIEIDYHQRLERMRR